MADLHPIDYGAGSDTGRNNAASVAPLLATDLLGPEAFNRPIEVLRARSERIRADLGKVVWMLRQCRWLLISASSGSPAHVPWTGPWDGVSATATLGRFLPSADVVIVPQQGPGAGRAAAAVTNRYFGGTPHSSLRATTTRTFGSDSIQLYARIPAESGATWLSFQIVVSAGALADPLVEVFGTAAAAADAAFLPGVHEIRVTVANGGVHTVQDVVDAINADGVAGALVNAVVGGAGTEIVTASAKAFLSDGAGAIRLRLAYTEFASFFSASDDNRLREGDTLAVYLASVETLMGLTTEDGAALTAASLVNLTREPEKALQSIPLARVLGGSLQLLNGVNIPARATTELDTEARLHLDPHTAKSIPSFAITTTYLTLDASNVHKQLKELASAVSGLQEGVDSFEALSINYPSSGVSRTQRLGIYEDSPSYPAGLELFNGRETASLGDELHRIDFLSTVDAVGEDDSHMRLSVHQGSAAGTPELRLGALSATSPGALVDVRSWSAAEIVTGYVNQRVQTDRATYATRGFNYIDNYKDHVGDSVAVNTDIFAEGVVDSAGNGILQAYWNWFFDANNAGYGLSFRSNTTLGASSPSVDRLRIRSSGHLEVRPALSYTFDPSSIDVGASFGTATQNAKTTVPALALFRDVGGVITGSGRGRASSIDYYGPVHDGASWTGMVVQARVDGVSLNDHETTGLGGLGVWLRDGNLTTERFRLTGSGVGQLWDSSANRDRMIGGTSVFDHAVFEVGKNEDTTAAESIPGASLALFNGHSAAAIGGRRNSLTFQAYDANATYTYEQARIAASNSKVLSTGERHSRLEFWVNAGSDNLVTTPVATLEHDGRLTLPSITLSSTGASRGSQLPFAAGAFTQDGSGNWTVSGGHGIASVATVSGSGSGVNITLTTALTAQQQLDLRVEATSKGDFAMFNWEITSSTVIKVTMYRLNVLSLPDVVADDVDFSFEASTTL